VRLSLVAAVMVGLGLASADLSTAAALPGEEWGVEANILEGTVREASGRPIPTARVEVRTGDGLLGSTRTDREGFFRLVVRSDATGPRTLRVARFGYHSHERTLEPGADVVDVVLHPAPLPLPGLDVEAIRDVCSGREDEEARVLWERAAAMYPGGLDTLGLATYLHGWSDTLRSSSMSDEEGRVGEPGQRGSAPLLRLSWDRRVQRQGYAFPVRRTDREHSYDSWSYAPLEADFAPHFVHRTFGRLHRFHVEGNDRDGWELRFCSRDRDQPYLEGTLELGPDTALLRAEWRFRTTEPDEEAGGWVRFPEPTLDEPLPVPLPVESMIWRRLPDGELLRKAQSYEGWILAPGDSVPFLRSRANGSGDEGRPG